MTQPQRLLSHFANRYAQPCDPVPSEVLLLTTDELVSAMAALARYPGWVELWDSDESDLWDRGTPSAALIDWIESRPAQLNQSTNRRQLMALVPVCSPQAHLRAAQLMRVAQGCGRGYDVVMLALHGFDVIGLELSPKGAEVARAYAESELSDPQWRIQ